MTIQELKRRIRKFRKVKKSLRVGSKERNDVNKILKELKKEYKEKLVPTGEKQEVIEELTSLYKRANREVVVDFRNYTIDELRFHLNKVKAGG